MMTIEDRRRRAAAFEVADRRGVLRGAALARRRPRVLRALRADGVAGGPGRLPTSLPPSPRIQQILVRTSHGDDARPKSEQPVLAFNAGIVNARPLYDELNVLSAEF